MLTYLHEIYTTDVQRMTWKETLPVTVNMTLQISSCPRWCPIFNISERNFARTTDMEPWFHDFSATPSIIAMSNIVFVSAPIYTTPRGFRVILKLDVLSPRQDTTQWTHPRSSHVRRFCVTNQIQKPLWRDGTLVPRVWQISYSSHVKYKHTIAYDEQKR